MIATPWPSAASGALPTRSTTTATEIVAIFASSQLASPLAL